MAGRSDSFAPHRRSLSRGVAPRFLNQLGNHLKSADLTPTGADRWIRVDRAIMGQRFEVVLPCDQERHVPIARAAFDAAERSDELLTLVSEATELTTVNRIGNQKPIAGATVLPLLRLASDVVRDTAGALTLTSAIGSFKRGFVLDRMAAVFRKAGVQDVLISAGERSVLALGGSGRTPWLTALWSTATGERLIQMHLKKGALGSAGVGDPLIQVNGLRDGHIVDPRTAPRSPGIQSVSVAASRSAIADALSSAFLIGGAALARRYCESHAGVLAILTPDAPENDRARPMMFGRFTGVRVEHLERT
jgi:thiamine biosynthesis lipoprotein ApbE